MAITWKKLAFVDDVILKSLLTTRGDMIFRNASIPARLAKGTDGDVLTMGPSDPAWSAPAGGGATLTISETEVFSGTAPTSWTDLDLSGVVGSQKALVLLKILLPTSTRAVAVRANGDTDEFFSSNAFGQGAALFMSRPSEHFVVIVTTDANGVIEWRAETATGSTTVDIIAFIK